MTFINEKVGQQTSSWAENMPLFAPENCDLTVNLEYDSLFKIYIDFENDVERNSQTNKVGIDIVILQAET